jgi:hypothetical protein
MVRTMLWAPLALLAALAPFASADVEFVWPKAGERATGGNAVVVEWKDSGEKPPLSEFTTYQLFLCAGGNDEFVSAIPLLRPQTRP